MPYYLIYSPIYSNITADFILTLCFYCILFVVLSDSIESDLMLFK